MDKSTTPFRTLRQAFKVYNQTTGKSPKTVGWYEFRLELFERWLGPDASLADVTIPNVRAYIAELQGRTERWTNNPFIKNKDGQLSSSYINGFARALRAFASWLYEDGYTEDNVLQRLKPPKIQQKVVEVLTDEEVARLVAAFNLEDAFGARDYAAVWTLLDCGLRASELCELTLENAHLAQGYLKVLGKGNKERLVPIGRRCQEALLRWRDRFRPLFELNETAYLFLGSNGVALSVDALDALVDRAGRRAGITRVYCHLLRHTFATNYLVKEVGDSLRLQQILGHTSLEMVRRYVAMANVQQSLIERRASPMDLIAQDARPTIRSRRVQPRRPRRGLMLVK
ncbi:MAG: tyrosine-type recombinase/integrase [Dehalococcoidia bacterium]